MTRVVARWMLAVALIVGLVLAIAAGCAAILPAPTWWANASCYGSLFRELLFKTARP
jgi:ABC-type arginine/histidine transport system permease subunit